MKIAIISQPEYFRFIYEDELKFLGEVKEFKFHFDMKESDFDLLMDFDADINIFFRGEFMPESILKKLRGVKINLSSEPFPKYIEGKLVCSYDSINRFETFKMISNKSYDYVFHYDKTSISFLEKNGFLISGEFYFPIALAIYSKRKNIKKKWDFFFIGRSTKHREKYFGYLKHKYNFLHICHGVYGKELVQYMNMSKILLNVHAEDEISWEPRLQMMIATGNLVISEKITPNEYLIPNVHYIEVNSIKEFHEACEYYLYNEKEADLIAQNGLKRIKECFDSQKQFLELFNKIANGYYNKFKYVSSKKDYKYYTLKYYKYIENTLKKY